LNGDHIHSNLEVGFSSAQKNRRLSLVVQNHAMISTLKHFNKNNAMLLRGCGAGPLAVIIIPTWFVKVCFRSGV